MTDRPEDVELPRPTLQILIAQLATQAAMELGEAPNPLTGKRQVSLPRARFTIGLIEVIEEKTREARTPDEDRLISEILTRLRMDFVKVGREGR